MSEVDTMTLPDALAVAAFCVLATGLLLLFGAAIVIYGTKAVRRFQWEDYEGAVLAAFVVVAGVAGILGALSVLAAILQQFGA